MVATTPLIAFWIIGDQSLPGNPNDLDYLFRIRIDSTIVLIAGVHSSLALVAAARHLAVNRSSSGGKRVAQFVALLMLAGVLLAFGLRIVTAGVIGANIGGALLIMVGLPFWAAAVVAAIVRFWRSGRTTRTTSTVAPE